jgi:excisionase family DNA binding protein
VTPAALALAEAERRLTARVQQLCAKLDAGEDVWREYETAVAALNALVPAERKPLLTTAQLAEQLNLSPRTVRKHARAGKIQAEAVRLGRAGRGAIRWRSA